MMLIPIHDENPVRRVPVVTYALILMNLIVFLLEPIVSVPFSSPTTTQASVCDQVAFFREYAAIPKEMTSNEPLPETAGPPVAGGCQAVEPTYRKIPFLSVLYAMFLHGGWLHLLGNMLFLFVFGNNVEDRLGKLRFLLFYLVTGYVAAYAFAFAQPSSTDTLVGASGAIAGVLGAYLVLYPRARVTSLMPFLLFLPVRLPAWMVLGSWFVLQYLYAQGTGLQAGAGVAYLAHVAGFIAGMLLALPLHRARRPPQAPPVYPWPA